MSRFEGYSHQSRDHTVGVSGTTYLDLLQVDLLASGASLVWPRSGRPCEIRWRTFLKVYYVPNVVLLEGGGGSGGSFENFEVKWRYSQTNKQVNACASQKGQEESLPLGRVDGRPQTSIVFIWNLTKFCLISLCYHRTVKSELSWYFSARPVRWVGGPSWMSHVGSDCLSYPGVAFH